MPENSGQDVKAQAEKTKMTDSNPVIKRKTFLDFPPEVRNQIYEEVLVLKLPQQAQDQLDSLQSPSCPIDGFSRNNAIDHLTQEIQILPNRQGGYPGLWAGVGLLLVNKKIHDEATRIMFSKNTFAIQITGDDRKMFWHCHNGLCDNHFPCFIHHDSLIHIKHVKLNVHLEERAGNTPEFRKVLTNALFNITNMARVFSAGENKLETLNIRFTSSFGGQVEAVRDVVEKMERLVIMKDIYGATGPFEKSDLDNLDRLACIFKPLERLLHKPQMVMIRGDMSKACLDKVRDAIQSKQPHAATRRKAAKIREQETSRVEANKHVDGPFAAFIEEMIHKHPEDEDFYKRILETKRSMPFMSPRMQEAMFFGPTLPDVLNAFHR